MICFFSVVQLMATEGTIVYSIVQKDRKYACIDSSGRLFITWRDEKISPFVNSNLGNVAKITSGKFPVNKYDEETGRNARYGLINIQGKELLPAEYEDLKISADTGVWLKENGKWGFMSVPGQWSIPPVYDDCSDFSEGVAAVKKDAKWGVVNKTNTVVIAFTYDEIFDFNKGYAVASLQKNGNSKKGLIDRKGNWKIASLYDDLFYMRSYKLWVYASQDSCGFVDEVNSVKKKIPYRLDRIDEKTITLYDVKNKLYGFYDYSVDRFIAPQYDHVSGYAENGWAYVTFHEGPLGIIDGSGKVIAKLPCINDMWHFENVNSLLPYHEGNVWGFADLECKVILQPLYSQVSAFVSNRAAVQDRNSRLWGLIDRNGRWLITPQYDGIESYEYTILN